MELQDLEKAFPGQFALPQDRGRLARMVVADDPVLIDEEKAFLHRIHDPIRLRLGEGQRRKLLAVMFLEFVEFLLGFLASPGDTVVEEEPRNEAKTQ